MLQDFHSLGRGFYILKRSFHFLKRVFYSSSMHDRLLLILLMAVLLTLALALSGALDQRLARYLSLAGFVFVLFLLLARTGTEILLRSKFHCLVEATARLSAGDLSARSDLSSEPGEVGRLAAAFNDLAAVLERRESQFRQAEANYSNLFNRLPVGLYRTTPGGEILDANPALVELLGFPSYEALVNTNTVDLHVDHDSRRLEKELLVGDGIARGFELQLQRYDGRQIWVRDTVRTVHDAGGQVLYYEGHLEDITERRRAEAALRELATRDELTGLFNRRELMRLVAEEVERHQRHGRPVSLAMIDIDHFKQVNDAYGHPAGDQVLRGFARLLLSQLRSLDRPARYGGEEFAILMPETDQSQAFLLAERIRQSVAGHAFIIPQAAGSDLNIVISVTIGVGEMSPGIHTKEALIEAVDRMLYAGKRQGRNRTVCLQPERKNS